MSAHANADELGGLVPDRGTLSGFLEQVVVVVKQPQGFRRSACAPAVGAALVIDFSREKR